MCSLKQPAGRAVGAPFTRSRLLVDDSKAGVVRRGVPAVLASVDPAVDHGVSLARFVADAGAAPEGHDDLAGPPRVPLRARGRVGPPDRKVVRQAAVIHRSIRTQVPSSQRVGLAGFKGSEKFLPNGRARLWFSQGTGRPADPAAPVAGEGLPCKTKCLTVHLWPIRLPSAPTMRPSTPSTC